MTPAVQALNILVTALPSLINMVAHYEEIASRPDTPPEDKEKAKALLESMRWKSFDELEKEAAGE
ncbi:MAG: hypothetical protein C4560_03050 [Nitrospiraceae bacterium]|nr:MAG: hypothetical protein C4560_03050 [Nitrospiraceae bacterium]